MELLQKLKQLEQNISLLEEIKQSLKLEDICNNKRYEWELRYGLFESIQIVINISCKIANNFNLGTPQNYKECLELLGKFNYIDSVHVKTFSSMIGLTNILIHEYTAIDTRKLYEFLDSTDDFKTFISEIKSNVVDVL
jgi:uncharacterized protein YutE (UPF0331/DUF86 family)